MPATTDHARLRPGDWLTLLAVLFFVLRAARTLFDPAAAAAGFGLPLHHPGDGALMQVVAVRNLFVAAFASFLVLGRLREVLRAFMLLLLALPVGDAALLLVHVGAVPQLALHAGIEAVLVVVNLVLWREQSRAAAP